MAHFAQLDDNNKVINVIVVSNDTITVDGVEKEELGVELCRKLIGADTRWKQTSYSGSFRKNYAPIGGHYDEALDAFIGVKPYPSWQLDENTCRWAPPKPMPSDGRSYIWDEGLLRWVAVS